MLKKYAKYAKYNRKKHFLLCFLIFITFALHVSVLLETESVILLMTLVFYIPIYILWSKVSTIKERMPD